MMSWLAWAIFAIPAAFVLTWGQRRRSRHLDAMRRYDPDMAARIERTSFDLGPAGLSTRIRGFDKRDQY